MVSSLERWFASLFAVVVLAGCAGPQVSTETTPEAIQGLGVVVVSVTHDAETGRKGRAGFVIDRGVKAYEPRILRSIEEVLGVPRGSDFEDVHGRVYVLDMKPGIHKVSSWFAQSGMSRIAPRQDPAPLTFEVKAGEVVYIGNLNLNHQLGRSPLGFSVVGGAQPEVRDRSEIDVPIAEEKVPSIKGRVLVRLLPVGAWSLDSADDVKRTNDLPPAFFNAPQKP